MHCNAAVILSISTEADRLMKLCVSTLTILLAIFVLII